jgi:hypothetical protein
MGDDSTVAAKKPFHMMVGFWFSAIVVDFAYLIGTGLYELLTGVDIESGTPVFFMFPRFAMMLSVPLPLVFGIGMFGHRRYVAIGAMTFGVVAFVCWYLMGSRG